MIQVILLAAVTSAPLACIPCAKPAPPQRPVYSPLGLIAVERAELDSARDLRERMEACQRERVKHGWSVICVDEYDTVAWGPTR